MDSASFDRLTRFVGKSASRRLLGGAVLGTLTTLLGIDAAEAARCPRGKKKCKKRCIPRKACCTNANCKPSATGRVCKRGRCVCPPGRPKKCNGRCIPATQCCGVICDLPNATASCVSDECVIDSCVDGFSNCDNDAENGCETNLNEDTQHCGDCGHACNAGEHCCDGQCLPNSDENCGGCGISCNPGTSCCDGTCQNTTVDPQHCGSCGHVCPGFNKPNTNVRCEAGECTFFCLGETYDVDGDPDNGCEVADMQTGSHVQGTARVTDPASADTCTSNPITFTGQILSDDRTHIPAIAGFDDSTGSAPDWWRIGTIADICGASAEATIRTSGGTSETCYRLTVQNSNGQRQSVNVSGNNPDGVSPASLSYTPGTNVYFEIRKICYAEDVTEAVTYTVEFEL